MEVNSIAEMLFFTTVRIDTKSEKSNGSGTGFIFNHTYKGNSYPFIVTNKHVVNGYKDGGITFIQKENEKPKYGQAFRLDLQDFEKCWFGHADPKVDIAVAPLAHLVEHMNKLGVEVFFKSVSTENIPIEQSLNEIDAIEEVVFIGYPNGIWDSKNFIPVARKGSTATPLSIDFELEKKFLIDASVFGGSSGSPVFIYNTGTYGTKGGPAKVGTRFHFVGVIAAVYQKTEANEIISVPIPTTNVPVAINKQMIDLGIVFKAVTVVETIEQLLASKGL